MFSWFKVFMTYYQDLLNIQLYKKENIALKNRITQINLRLDKYEELLDAFTSFK
jgi:hypothetical protein